MSGHTCILCDIWNDTAHAKYPTTPVQPAQAEMLLIIGWWARTRAPADLGKELCEKHSVAMSALDDREDKRETPQRTAEEEKVLAGPISVPCPQCFAKPGSMCQPSEGGFHPLRIAVIEEMKPKIIETSNLHEGTKVQPIFGNVPIQTKKSSIDEILPSKIPIPEQQPVFGKPLTVPCPTCGAPIGTPCAGPNGPGIHKLRKDAASPQVGLVDEFEPMTDDAAAN